MKELSPFLFPALALFVILRRGLKPRRIKANGLWTFPIILTILALLSLSKSGMPAPLALGAYVVALVGGLALGWYTTQHIELTLDPKTGTIMSQQTLAGTLLTAGVFALRFAVEYLVEGTPGGAGGHVSAHHAAGLVWLSNAALLFVAARMLGRAWHLWIRTRPLLEQIEQHKAANGK
jgi:hypothetical protein